MNAARMIGALSALGFYFHTDLQADNWPAWRGPLGTGICAEKNFPTKWAVNQNIKWRVSLPERGNSSPVVWGNQIFITQAIEAQGLRQLLCFRSPHRTAACGNQRWNIK